MAARSSFPKYGEKDESPDRIPSCGFSRDMGAISSAARILPEALQRVKQFKQV
jgi:hypothetical protein